MIPITIHEVTVEEAALIKSLSYKIWPVVYDYMISPKQIDYMLQQMYSIESLTEQFNQGHRFYIAYAGESPIGFASWNAIDKSKAKLQKLYVMAEWHGHKVGYRLLQHIEQLIKSEGYSELLLNVNRNNKSIAFYERYGFIKTETVDLDIGNGFFMNDYVMMKKL